MSFSKIFLVLILIPASFYFQRLSATADKELESTSKIALSNKGNLIKSGAVFSFEENIGQAKSNILFISRMSGKIVCLFKDKLELRSFKNTKIKIGFDNSNVKRIAGRNPLNQRSNYFFGSRKIPDVTHFERIKYSGIYKNIDLEFYFNENELEFDFEIYPGGNLEDVSLNVEGAKNIFTDWIGSIHIIDETGEEIILRKPNLYQLDRKIKKEIKGGFELKNNNRIIFKTAEYNPSLALVVDPILSFSTYIPGSYTDIANSIFLDKEGYIYLTGETNSSTFPIKNAVQSKRGGGWSDIFITKLNKDANEIIFSTYFGGSDTENGYEIKVDGEGYIYVTGNTSSADFPIKNAFQTNFMGGILGDAFILKLSPAGNEIIFSTYFGGSDSEISEGIAIDVDGDIVIAGQTTSKNLPLKNAYQTEIGSGTFPRDAFVAKFNKSGSNLVFSTYFGGQSMMGDAARDVTVDLGKNIYITGYTTSTDFPVIDGFQKDYNGGTGQGDAFIAKFNPNGIPLYSTFFGGTQDDEGKSIVVDDDNNIYLTGATNSADFPEKNGIHNRMGIFDYDVFISKMAASGEDLYFSTYLGGSDVDEGRDITIDNDNNIYVTGYTVSPNFRVVDAAYGYNAGIYPPYREDAFITKLKNDGSAFEFSTFFGGNEDDAGNSVAVDAFKNVYITGFTESGFDLPIKNALYPLPGEVVPDAFVAKFVMGTLLPPHNLEANLSGNDLTLTWQPPATGTVLSYNIYRSPETPVIINNQNLIFSTSQNSYSEQIIMTGTNYFYVVTAVYDEGESLPSNEASVALTGIQTFSDGTPYQFSLYQNFPNPFNSSTKIRFSIPEMSSVCLKILDILGGEISTLVQQELDKGNFEINVDMMNLPSGIYFYRLQVGNFADTKKMILLR